MVNLQNIIIFNKDYLLGEFDRSIEMSFKDMSYDINNLINVLNAKYIYLSKSKCEPYNAKFLNKLTTEANHTLSINKELMIQNFHKSILDFIDKIGGNS